MLPEEHRGVFGAEGVRLGGVGHAQLAVLHPGGFVDARLELALPPSALQRTRRAHHALAVVRVEYSQLEKDEDDEEKIWKSCKG